MIDREPVNNFRNTESFFGNPPTLGAHVVEFLGMVLTWGQWSLLASCV